MPRCLPSEPDDDVLIDLPPYLLSEDIGSRQTTAQSWTSTTPA